MQHNDLKDMAAQAVDLGSSQEAQKAAAEARAAAAQQAAEGQVARWDRAMTRTFKGILPAPQRRRMLNEAVKRHGG